MGNRESHVQEQIPEDSNQLSELNERINRLEVTVWSLLDHIQRCKQKIRQKDKQILFLDSKRCYRHDVVMLGYKR